MLGYKGCGMIAVKREVAGRFGQVFRGANVKLGNWRQVSVQLNDFCVTMQNEVWMSVKTHTGKCTVTACRTFNQSVRKGGDFFYGKSGNENYIKSL